MAANKLINFRCPDDLLTAIKSYGREHYPAALNNRSNIDFDQSKALRDILISGLETLTNGEVKLDREPVRQSNKSDNSHQFTEILDRIIKLENQQKLKDPGPTWVGGSASAPLLYDDNHFGIAEFILTIFYGFT